MDAQALLGVALGLVVIYFLMAVVCSFTLETVYAISNLRGRALSRFLEEMLRGTSAARLPEDVWANLDLFKHPIIEGLKKPEWRLGGRQTEPSYIPAASISQALIDKLWKNYGEKCIPIDENFRTAVAKLHSSDPLRSRLSQTAGSQICLVDIELNVLASFLPNLPNASIASKPLTDLVAGFSRPKELTFEMLEAIVSSNKLGVQLTGALRAILFDAQADLRKVYLGIERWYDSVMDRATGWFKRHSLMILGISAFAIAVAFNINTITIAKTLYENKEARNAFEQLAVGLQQHGYSPTDNKKLPVIYLLTEQHARLQGELSGTEITAITGALITMLHPNPSLVLGSQGEEADGIIENCHSPEMIHFNSLLKISCQLYLKDDSAEILSAWRIEIFKIVNEYQKTMNSLDKSVELLNQFEPIWQSKITSQWLVQNAHLQKGIYFIIVALIFTIASLIWLRNSKIAQPSRVKEILLLLALSLTCGLETIYLINYYITIEFWAWLAGVILTAIMASFGAPFWFDLLNKLVNRRAAGPKPAGSESMFG